MVGNEGVLEGARRAASVTAVEETEAVELNAAVISELLRRAEASEDLCRALSQSQSETDAREVEPAWTAGGATSGRGYIR
jgi:CRP-like cAMP-binding protein